jgi:hypothetical protein
VGRRRLPRHVPAGNAAWELLQALQKGDPEGYKELHFTVYDGLAHSFPPGEPSAGMKWILEKRRNAFPEKLVWETNDHPEPRLDRTMVFDRPVTIPE